MVPFKCCQIYRKSRFDLMPALQHIWQADTALDPVECLQKAIECLHHEIAQERARAGQQKDLDQ